MSKLPKNAMKMFLYMIKTYTNINMRTSFLVYVKRKVNIRRGTEINK